MDVFRISMNQDTTTCRHCGVNFARRRYLCDKCYQTHWRNYPCVPDQAVLEPLTPAQKPTKAHPNTPEKLDVLCKRYENREELWHPQDARGPIVYANGFDATTVTRTILRRVWCTVPPSESDV
jgi:hypothetical protein